MGVDPSYKPRPMHRSQLVRAITRQMIEKGVTITEAAEMAGVHRTTMGRFLRGQVTMRSDHVSALLVGLGLVVVPSR